MKILRIFLAGMICLPWITGALPVQAANQQNNIIQYRKFSNRIELELEIADWDWQSAAGGERLIVENAAYQDIPGCPSIPIFSTLVAIPPLDELQTDANLGTQKKLIPPTQTILINPELQNELDIEGYPSTAQGTECAQATPQEYFQVDSPAWIRDQRVVRVEFFPFQWDSQQKIWVLTTDIQINLLFGNLSQEKQGADLPAAQNVFDSALQNSLINYQDGLGWRSLTHSVSLTLLDQDQDLSAGFESDPHIRLTTTQAGVYRVRYEDLALLDLDLTQYQMDQILLENQGRSVSIERMDDGDEFFEPDESILFFAEEFDGTYLAGLSPQQDDHWLVYENGWAPQFSADMIEKYNDKNVYWLSFNSEGSNLIAQVPQTTISPSPAESFPFLQKFEQDNEWWTLHLTSEETWFWERNITVASAVQTRNYTFSLADVDTGALGSAELQLEMTSSSSLSHAVEVYLNDQLLQTITWEGRVWQSLSIPFEHSLLLAGENRMQLRFLPISGIAATRYGFDQFNIKYTSLFKAHGNELTFSNQETGEFSFQVDDFSDESLQVWDISSPLTPVSLTNLSLEGGSLVFSNNQTGPTTYLAFGQSALRTPQMDLTYFDDLQSASNQVDYLVISSGEFISALQPLLDWRSEQGLSVKVVDLQQVYDQFNFGIPHPIAIKNFMRTIFQTWETAPTYVLLVGDGHWDIKNKLTSQKVFIPPNFVWVDPVQGEIDSLSDLVAVVGDDPLPDAFIGRFSVNSEAELNAMINKTIAFEQGQGEWLKSLTFLADNYQLVDACFDGNDATPCSYEPAGNFPALMDSFIQEKIRKSYSSSRFYLDDYHCTTTNASACDQLTSDLIAQINNDPSQIYTFSGHGAINGWASERIFNASDLSRLTNSTEFPIFFSLDCVDGFWYYPPGISGTDNRSLAEELSRMANAGAAAVYASSGYGYASGHEYLLRGFFEDFQAHRNPSIGHVDLAAKLKAYASGVNDELIFTFMIFGDPALSMANDAFFNFLPVIIK